VGLTQAGDLADDGASLHIDHLDHGSVGDEELERDGVQGEVVPVTDAADDPGLLDGVGVVGESRGAGNLLRVEGRGEGGAYEEAENERAEVGGSLHRD